ncbi:hypothetical protein Gpo141_00008013, partial [Globisporangium polare]
SVVTATAAQTLLKPRASTCCQACSVATTCKPLLSLPSGSSVFALSRCEPVVSTSTRGLAADVTAFAAQLFVSARDSATALAAVAPGVLAVAAGAVAVLLLAGFVARGKVQKQQREKLLHEAVDVYVLMEQ